MFNWMSFMISSTGGKWTLVKSGNGISSYQPNSSSQPAITSETDISNNRAWFILRQPNSTREFCFQTSSTRDYWRIKYSFSGFSSGSPSATQTPSASDEQILFGGGTDSSPTTSKLFPLTEGNFIFNSCADDDGYSFYFFAYSKGNLRSTSAITTLFIFDNLKQGSRNQNDADPSIMYIGNSGTLNYINQICYPSDDTSSKFKGYMCKGISSKEAFVNIGVASWGTQYNAWSPSLSDHAENPHNSSEDLCPILYFYKNKNSPANLDPSQGYKGTSNAFFIGSLQRVNGDLYDYDDLSGGSIAGKKIYIAGFALPWNNASPTP